MGKPNILRWEEIAVESESSVEWTTGKQRKVRLGAADAVVKEWGIENIQKGMGNKKTSPILPTLSIFSSRSTLINVNNGPMPPDVIFANRLLSH